MFQKMYADEPDSWQEVDEDIAKMYLSDWYNNIDDVMQAIRDGQVVRTPSAFYRWIPL